MDYRKDTYGGGEHGTLGEQLFHRLGDVQRDHHGVDLYKEKCLAESVHKAEVAARVILRTRGLRRRLARMLVGADAWDALESSIPMP